MLREPFGGLRAGSGAPASGEEEIGHSGYVRSSRFVQAQRKIADLRKFEGRGLSKIQDVTFVTRHRDKYT
jgi:hypothetical protein